MRSVVFPSSMRRLLPLLVGIVIVASAVSSFAAPGGRGGPGGAGGRGGVGGGPGGAGGPGGRGGPGVGGGVGGGGGPRGMNQMGPGPGSPAGIGGPAVGRPAVGPGGPAGAAKPSDVEKFLGAQPGARPNAGAARTAPATAAIAGRTQPFTPSWYADHPNAWRYPNASVDWWAVGSPAAVFMWLGYPAPGAAAATTTTAATGVAAPQAVAPPADAEWLPLGVFAAGPKSAGDPHVYLQLAVSKQGEMKGNYYDAVSDATQPIAGSIDKASRRATWTVGKGATFETTLDALLKTPSDATVKSGSIKQVWQLTQVEKPQ